MFNDFITLTVLFNAYLTRERPVNTASFPSRTFFRISWCPWICPPVFFGYLWMCGQNVLIPLFAVLLENFSAFSIGWESDVTLLVERGEKRIINVMYNIMIRSIHSPEYFIKISFLLVLFIYEFYNGPTLFDLFAFHINIQHHISQVYIIFKI